MKQRVAAVFNPAVYIIAGIVLCLAVYSKPWPVSDYYVHMATLRQLAAGQPLELLPLDSHPFLLRRLWEPQHLLWAQVLKRTSLSGTDVMALAGVINIILFLAGAWFLARRFQRRGALPGILLLTMLFIWGVGYRWSNEYYFSALPETAPYPSTLSWALSFFAFGLIIDWSRRDGWPRLGAAVALGGMVVLVHTLTAIAFTLPFPVLWVWLSRAPARRKSSVLVYPAAALIIGLLWPVGGLTEQIIGAMAPGMTPGGARRSLEFIRPVEMLLALGPLPIAALFLLWVPRGTRRALACGIGVYAAGWLGMTLLGVPLAHRAVFYLAFVLHLTFALAVMRGVEYWMRQERALARRLVPVGVSAAIVMLIPWGPLHVCRVGSMIHERVGLRHLQLGQPPLEKLEREYQQIRDSLPAGSHVICDKHTSVIAAGFALPVHRGGAVGQSAPEAIDADYVSLVREQAKRVRATHLLLPQRNYRPEERGRMNELGAVTVDASRVVLIQLRPSALPADSKNGMARMTQK